MGLGYKKTSQNRMLPEILEGSHHPHHPNQPCWCPLTLPTTQSLYKSCDYSGTSASCKRLKLPPLLFLLLSLPIFLLGRNNYLVIHSPIWCPTPILSQVGQSNSAEPWAWEQFFPRMQSSIVHSLNLLAFLWPYVLKYFSSSLV